jgi:hypothetical protein
MRGTGAINGLSQNNSLLFLISSFNSKAHDVGSANKYLFLFIVVNQLYFILGLSSLLG